jgi:hypothetical protein
VTDKTPRTYLRLANDEERKETFLRVLAETGSVAAACQAASPHAEGPRACKSTFFELRRRSPEFAAAWDEAIHAALGVVESEIMRRAMHPATSPVTDRQGNVIGTKEDRWPADRLLLRIASRLDPQAWAERKREDHVISGSIAHHAYTLDASLVARLPRERQILLLDLIQELADLQQGVDPSKRIEAAVEVTNGEE